jgi:hypothetical protein
MTMTQIFMGSWRPGRGAVLVLGVVALAGLFLATSPAGLNPGKAQAAPPARSGPARKAPAKEAGSTVEIYTPVAVKEAPELLDVTKLINDKVAAGWKANKVTPSRPVNDYEFIRRASLDIVGRIATPQEISAYMKDPADKRRSLLIEKLLADPDYIRHWANLWTNWLLSRSGVFGRGTYHDQMALWLEDQFSTNTKYHEIVRKLITAKGTNTDNGAVNFILAHVGENVPPAKRKEEGQFQMVPITSRITRLFLGTQIQCAQCHDHPFYGSLKQGHFWGVNAFLRQVTRKGTPPNMMRRNMMAGPLTLEDNTSYNEDGVIVYEKRNGVLLPTRAQFLPPSENKEAKGPRLDLSPDAPPRREQLANFVIEHDNFARAIVNRMWGVFMGRGFVNPIDDFNDNNQVNNPELLNELGVRFKHYNYDLKKLIRWITNSNPYHLSCVANKTNDKPEHEVLFSRMVLKSLSPEQLFESLMVATRTELSKKDKKDRKQQWLGNLIKNFGDDEGNEVSFNGTVVQALLMMNGNDINEAIARKDKGTVAVAMARSRMPAVIIRELYLAALNRPPTTREVTGILQRLPLRRGFQGIDNKNPAAPYQDVFWALLNSNEFLLNH